MRSKKEQTQIIVLCVVLGLIAVLLIWNFRNAFLPHAAGEPVVLEIPSRLDLPRVTNADNRLYDRSDFKGIAEDKFQPLRPGEITGNGSPFDDILPE